MLTFRAVFTSIEEKLSPAFQDKGIYLVVRCDNGLTLCADEARLEQILINLLNNALIYCAPGDMTTVTVKQDSGILSIIVEDTGKEFQRRIYRIFLIGFIEWKNHVVVL